MPAQFELTLVETDTLLATVPATDPFSVNLNVLGMAAGDWTLSLLYRDQYGTASALATIPVSVDALGAVITKLRAPTGPVAQPQAAGMVLLRWAIEAASTGASNPAEFEIVEAADPGTVLATVLYSGIASAYQQSVGPFANAAAVNLMVRATDGGSVVTPWVSAATVIADSVGPDAPTIVEP